MSIKFNFTVSDVDAENIISCLQDRVNKENQAIIKIMVAKNEKDVTDAKKKQYDAEIDWYRRSIKYTEELSKTMCDSIVRISDD